MVRIRGLRRTLDRILGRVLGRQVSCDAEEALSVEGLQLLHVDNEQLQLLLRMLITGIMLLTRFMSSLKSQLRIMSVLIQRVFQADPMIHQC
ncbi:hypothetical protein HKD37_20G057771 [Glycine soja]